MFTRPVSIPHGKISLHADLYLPDKARGMVVFAHGTGSSRHSPRNRVVAARLHKEDLGTLLLDLLTEQEEAAERPDGGRRFDIGFLAARLLYVTAWLDGSAETAESHGIALGYFGASTGAAAALVAAAEQGTRVGAVVSRGGRPDMAGDSLGAVLAPTMLIVGGNDKVVLGLNERAKAQLRCPSELVVIKGATHLFEEHGALEQVAELAAGWFRQYLHGQAAGGDFEPATTGDLDPMAGGDFGPATSGGHS